MGDRDVPYDSDAICDVCGKIGAYDFMGDCVCEACLAATEDDETGD